MYELPPEPIKLLFEPDGPVRRKLSRDERFDAIHVRRIFRKHVTRNLWLGIRPKFITSQHFIPDIEFFGQKIGGKRLRCWHMLFDILSVGRDPVFSNLFSTHLPGIAEALL